MLKIRMARKRELIEKRINGIDAKIATLGELLPDSRKKYLVVEKEMFTQRAEHIQNLQIHDDKYRLKCFNQSRKWQANDLLEENRVKWHKKSADAPTVLDSKEEELIQKAIEDKSTAHGRRHDAVMYLNHCRNERFSYSCKLLFAQER